MVVGNGGQTHSAHVCNSIKFWILFGLACALCIAWTLSSLFYGWIFSLICDIDYAHTHTDCKSDTTNCHAIITAARCYCCYYLYKMCTYLFVSTLCTFWYIPASVFRIYFTYNKYSPWSFWLYTLHERYIGTRAHTPQRTAAVCGSNRR